MITGDAFENMALSLPKTEKRPHFDRIALKVIGRRMFATYFAEHNTADIFLTLNEQKRFCKMDDKNIYPVPNKWGEKGITTFELDVVAKNLPHEALLSAYNEIVKKKK